MDLLSLINAGTLAKLLPIIMIMNAALYAVSALLQKLIDQGEIKTGPVVSFLAGAASALQKVVDVVGMNPKH